MDNTDNLCEICGYDFDECTCNDGRNYPKCECVKLCWEIYPKCEDILSDGHSTMFITLVNENSVKEEISKLKEKFEFIQFQTNSLTNQNDYNVLKIFSDKKETAIIFQLQNCIVVRLLHTEYDQLIRDCLADIYLDKGEFFGEIKHIEEKITIKNSKIQSQIRTGVIKNDSFGEPRSFWNFYLNGRHIGKALIHFHAELTENCAPTIIMFEVFEDFRKKGFGSKMIKGIEHYIYKNNFSKIRIDNTHALPFWRKLGYSINRDEGERKFTKRYF